MTATKHKMVRRVVVRLQAVQLGDASWQEIAELLPHAEAGRGDVHSWAVDVETAFANGQAQVFAARGDDNVIGYVIASTADHAISALWVAPDLRGRGIAGMLYGVAAVSLGMSYPETIAAGDMRGELAELARTGNLVVQDQGHLCALKAVA
jgi:ribosomal protein S18 acetylase RimI-like enzyme